MTKKEKLLKILGDKFADDPKAVQTVHQALAAHYEKIHVQAVKELESQMREENQNAAKAMRIEFEGYLSGLANTFATKHMEAIARLDEVAENVGKNSEETGKVSKTLDQKVSDVVNLHKNLEKKMGKKFERYDNYGSRIEKISEFAVGAPNRSLYVAGALPSAYYSDTNFIAGSGVTIIGGTDETHQQATITISASGTGSGINPQIPSGTINSVNRTFTCVGLVTVAFADGTVDPSAVIAGATNSTITYSVPPQNNVFAL